MSDVTQTATSFPTIHLIGGIAILSGVISAAGVVFMLAMFGSFAASRQDLALKFGLINDICVALQYLLAVPIALALYQILRVYHPDLIRLATLAGVAAMLLVFGLQLLLVLGVLTFERQVIWATLAMILGVGSWLVITGLTARATGRLPNSVLMSLLAVPYVGFPVWAFWLGQHLLSW